MMQFLKKLIGRDPQPQSQPRQDSVDRGILVFEHTGEVIQAEKILQQAGLSIRVMGPPPEIQTGCDMVIEIPLVEVLNVRRLLEGAGLTPLQVVPVTSHLLQPVDLFHTVDFGDYLMVRAANMKITIGKKDLTIVNVSGGGCPDVPYLARQMVGKTLAEAPRPRDLGHTLCGYALDMAYEELVKDSFKF